MIDLEAVNLLQRLFLVVRELFFPRTIEVLEMLLTNLNVLAHLRPLNVDAQFVLELNDFLLEKAHLLHQVLIQLILVHFAALFGKQLHFLLDEGEDEDLLVLVENAIATLVENIDKLLRCTQTEHVIDVLTALFEYQTDVSFVKKTLLAEVSLLNGLPDLFAFASATNKRSSFAYKSVDLVARHVSQA
jgi:hypothetical protein